MAIIDLFFKKTAQMMGNDTPIQEVKEKENPLGISYAESTDLGSLQAHRERVIQHMQYLRTKNPNATDPYAQMPGVTYGMQLDNVRKELDDVERAIYEIQSGMRE